MPQEVFFKVNFPNPNWDYIKFRHDESAGYADDAKYVDWKYSDYQNSAKISGITIAHR